jgi:hypothetical protein
VKFENMQRFGNLCSNIFPILCLFQVYDQPMSLSEEENFLPRQHSSRGIGCLMRHFLSAVLKQTYSSDCSRGGRECCDIRFLLEGRPNGKCDTRDVSEPAAPTTRSVLRAPFERNSAM